MKKLKLSTKFLIASGLVLVGAGSLMAGLKIHSSIYKLGENTLETSGSFSTAFPQKKQVEYANFKDENNNIVATFDLNLDFTNQENLNKIINVKEGNKNTSMSSAQFKKWYAERYEGGTPIFELKIGAIKFVNEYYDALNPEEFVEYANWFMENVSWGPDLLSLSKFTLKKGVVLDGNNLTLGAHSNKDKEITEIVFYPDSFFGSMPIYSTLVGKGNAVDGLMHKINSVAFTKEELDEYIKTIPGKLVLANYDKGQKTSEIKGFDLLANKTVWTYDIRNFLSKEDQKKYGVVTDKDVKFYEERTAEELAQLEELKKLLCEDNQVKCVFDYEGKDLIQNKETEKERTFLSFDLNEEVFQEKAKLAFYAYLREKNINVPLEKIKFNPDKIVKNLKFLNASEEPKTKKMILNLENDEQESIKYSYDFDTKIQMNMQTLKNAEIISALAKVAQEKAESGFRDLYNINHADGKEIAIYENEEFTKFYKTKNEAKDFEQDLLDYSKLSLWKISSLEKNQKNLEINLVNPQDEKITKKIILDFENNLEKAQESFKYFKQAIKWSDAITPKIIKTEDIVNSEGKIEQGYILYSEAYANLIDEILKNNPYLAKKQNGTYLKVDFNNETNKIEYNIANGEYRGFIPGDRISFIELLKSSSKDFKGTGINYLKYVGTHEYGHHLTMQYAQDVSDPKEVVTPDAILNSGILSSNFYNKSILQLYLDARSSGIKVRKTKADYSSSENGLFPNYSLDKNGNFENIKDIFGANENKSVEEVLKNKSRRFIQEFNQLSEAAKARGVKLYDLFLLNSLDHESGTINPSASGQSVFFSDSPQTDKGFNSFAKDKLEYFKNTLKDGMGNKIEFDANNQKIIVATYKKNPNKNTFSDLEVKIFTKNNKPVIDVNSFNNPNSLSELESAINVVQKEFEKILVNKFSFNGWDEEISTFKIDTKNAILTNAIDLLLNGDFDKATIFTNENEWAESTKQATIVDKLENVLNSGTLENKILEALKELKIKEKEEKFNQILENDIQGEKAKIFFKDWILTMKNELFTLPFNYSPFSKTIKLSNGNSYITNSKYDSIITDWIENKAYAISDNSSVNVSTEGQGIFAKKKIKYTTPFNKVLNLWNDEKNKKLYIGRIRDFVVDLSKDANTTDGKSDRNIITLDAWDEEIFGFSMDNQFFVKKQNGDTETKLRTFDDFIEFVSIDPSKFTIIKNVENQLERKWDIDYALSKFDLFAIAKYINKELFANKTFNSFSQGKNDLLRLFNEVYGNNGEQELQKLANDMMNRFEYSSLNMFTKNVKITKDQKWNHLFISELGLSGFNNLDHIFLTNEDQYGQEIQDSRYALLAPINNLELEKEILNSEIKNQGIVMNAIYEYMEAKGINLENLDLQKLQFILGTKTWWMPFPGDSAKYWQAQIPSLDLELKKLSNLNKERFESDAKQYFSNYVFSFAEVLTRDFVQTTFIPSEQTTNNIPNFLTGLSENNTGNEYFVDANLTKKWANWINQKPDSRKIFAEINQLFSIAKINEDKNYVQKLKEIYEQSMNSNIVAEIVKIETEAKEKIEEIKKNINFGTKFIHRLKAISKANQNISMILEDADKEIKKITEKEVASFNNLLEYAKTISRLFEENIYNSINYSAANTRNYIGKNILSNNGFFQDRWQRKVLDWELYDDNRNPIKDSELNITDFDGQKITERPRALWIYNLKSQGIGSKTISGLWRDKDRDAITFWGFSKLSEHAKISKIAIEDPNTKKVAYINVNKENTNNLFYLQKQSDISSKRTLKDEGYDSWVSDFSIISGFSNSTVKPENNEPKKYLIYFVDEKNQKIPNGLTLGNDKYLAENGKLYSQAPVYLTQEEGEVYLIVQNQFSI